jgi:acetyltransferase-like isoleucine patch superfamily enzyme
MHVGRGTYLPKIGVTWPHQVSIGKECIIEERVFFKFAGIWKPGFSIVIGDGSFIGRDCEFNVRKAVTIGGNCLIGSGCKFIDHDHGIMITGLPMKLHDGMEEAIAIGEDVWLGTNVVVLKGVTIAEGSVIAAGAVVTKPVGPFEIWAGVPARKIGARSERASNVQ